jgi:hypothetical protein
MHDPQTWVNPRIVTHNAVSVSSSMSAQFNGAFARPIAPQQLPVRNDSRGWVINQCLGMPESEDK